MASFNFFITDRNAVNEQVEKVEFLAVIRERRDVWFPTNWPVFFVT